MPQKGKVVVRLLIGVSRSSSLQDINKMTETVDFIEPLSCTTYVFFKAKYIYKSKFLSAGESIHTSLCVMVHN
jgi:hypothetical protein